MSESDPARGTPHAALPLDGIRIIELGMVFVLPYALTPLAALGADVVKVEAAVRPDSVRWGPPPDNEPREDGYNHGAHFQMLNRNKRGITIDLTKPSGRALLLRFVAVSDVVAENFTPRVLRNLGLTYDDLRAVNERIILLSSSGFGQTGPWANYRAYGPNTEAIDGLMHVTGYPDGPPVRGGAGGLGVAFTDAAGAFYGAYSILAALEYRERTGTGQWLDLSHYEAGVATIPEAVLDYSINGRVQGRTANRHPWRAPQGVYPCAGNREQRTGNSGTHANPQSAIRNPQSDRWVAISVATDAQFQALASEMGVPELTADARFATLPARHANHDALDALIGGWTCGHAAEDLQQRLQAAGVEATVVATPRDVWADPQLWSRGFFQSVRPAASAPELGRRPHMRPAWKMSRSPAETRRRAPEFGEHTDEVLREYLQITDTEIAALEAEGVIAREPKPGALARPGPMDLPTLVSSRRLLEVDPAYRERLDNRLD